MEPFAKATGFACPENEFHRILGFGSRLTEFVVAPLRLSAAGTAKTSELGALANFIVSWYDYFLDSGDRPGTLLPGLYLRRLFSGSSPGSFPLWKVFLPGKSKCMILLVSSYAEKLQALAHVSARPDLYRTAVKIIMRMREAENDTLRKPGNGARDAALTRKSRLPFAILGQPGWLEAEAFETSAYLNHLRWLHLVGDFFGWIDDAADYAADKKNRHPNKILATFGQGELTRENEEALVKMLWRKQERIMAYWNASGAASPSEADKAWVFPVCVASWLGGH